MSNASVLKASVRKFEQIKRQQVMPLLAGMARTLLEDALSMRQGWAGFTGNLPTSYAAAVWDFDGKPFGDIIFAQDVDGHYSMSRIVRGKVEMGQSVHLDNPFEGQPRTTTGAVPVMFQWGPDMAHWFMLNFRPTFYPCICICTGAEYSQYLEAKGYNVLSDTADRSFVTKVGDMIFAGGEFTARNSITR